MYLVKKQSKKVTKMIYPKGNMGVWTTASVAKISKGIQFNDMR